MLVIKGVRKNCLYFVLILKKSFKTPSKMKMFEDVDVEVLSLRISLSLLMFESFSPGIH